MKDTCNENPEDLEQRNSDDFAIFSELYYENVWWGRRDSLHNIFHHFLILSLQLSYIMQNPYVEI